MRFSNSNHKLNTEGFYKVANPLDALMISNRPVEEILNVSSFSSVENESLNALIAKEAKVINDSEMSKTASEAIDKKAFLSNGLDMFASTRGLIAQKLGVSEDVAHDLTSSVLNKTDAIVNRYGGDHNQVVEGIVQEMGNSLLQDHHGLGAVSANVMKPTGTKDAIEHIQSRLVNEAGVTNFQAERLKHAVWKEARDLTTMLRPYDKYTISNAVIDLMIEMGDVNIVYGLKDSNAFVEHIRSLLS